MRVLSRPLAATVAALIASVPILVGVGVTAQAAPLPATYTATASGDILTVASTLLGAPIAAVDLVHSDASVDSADPLTPSVATSANLGVQVGPIGVGVSNTETAPPSHTESGTLIAATVPGVISTGVLNYTDTVNWAGALACVPAGTPISSAFTQTAGATVDLLAQNIVTTGVTSVTGATSLESISAVNDTRSVVATTTGSLADLSILGGGGTGASLGATVAVTSAPVLTATATGVAAPASSVTFTEAAATVTILGVTTTLVAGATVTLALPAGNSVTLHLASAGEVVGASTTTLTTAEGDAIVLSVDVNLVVPILLTPLGTVSLDLMPLHAEAVAPFGGVECDTIDPLISITTPADGSTTTDSTPPFTGTSDIISGTIELVIDGGAPITVPTDAAGDWAVTPATLLINGPHTATATATDAAGNTASDTTNFTVAAAAAAISITTPVDGSTTNDPTPPITGTSSVINGTITVALDGGAPVSVPTDGAGNWILTPATPLAEGSHTAVATATDAAGNTATDSTTFTVDATAPAISITTPADGSSTNDPTPPITGTSDIISGTIELVIDGGAPITVPTNATGDWATTSPALIDGSHTVVATATDLVGNIATDSTTFTVDTTPPAIAIVTPADGSSTNDPTPPITGTSGVISGTITVSIDGGAPVTVPTDSSGNWALTPTTPLADGVHIIDATATDALGNSATATTIFLVDTEPPAVAIVTPPDGSTTPDTTPPITGTSDIIDGTVTVIIDGGETIVVDTDGNGDWTLTPTTPLANGAHIVTVTAVDDAGNSSTATSQFTVGGAASGVPPDLAFTGVELSGLLALAMVFLLAGALAVRHRNVRR